MNYYINHSFKHFKKAYLEVNTQTFSLSFLQIFGSINYYQLCTFFFKSPMINLMKLRFLLAKVTNWSCWYGKKLEEIALQTNNKMMERMSW